MDITLLAIDDCMASAVVGLVDVFTLANAAATRPDVRSDVRFSVSVASPDGSDAAGFGGYALRVDCAMADAQPSDIIVIPPILRDVERVVDQHTDVVDWLRERSERGATLASVCTGAFFLGATGLLDGLDATTSHFMVPHFRRRYPNVNLRPDRRLVSHDTLICAGATTAYLQLAIHLVERAAGHGFAVLLAKHLVIDTNGGPQSPYFLLQPLREHTDERILALQKWIEDNHRTDLSIAQLCKRAAMSERSLTRSFRAAAGCTPIAYQRLVRIEVAKHLLESQQLGVDEITSRVGYVDARSFARLFKKATGISPAEYRRRFGAIQEAA